MTSIHHPPPPLSSLGTEELFAALEAAGLKRGRVVDPVPAEPYKTNPLVR